VDYLVVSECDSRAASAQGKCKLWRALQAVVAGRRIVPPAS
jgi:hypothetical protein